MCFLSVTLRSLFFTMLFLFTEIIFIIVWYLYTPLFHWNFYPVIFVIDIRFYFYLLLFVYLMSCCFSLRHFIYNMYDNPVFVFITTFFKLHYYRFIKGLNYYLCSVISLGVRPICGLFICLFILWIRIVLSWRSFVYVSFL